MPSSNLLRAQQSKLSRGFSFHNLIGHLLYGSLPDALFNLSYLTLLAGLYKVYSKDVRIISVEEIERERSGRSQIQDKLKARIENSIGLIRSMKEISGFSAEINVDVPEVDVKGFGEGIGLYLV